MSEERQTVLMPTPVHHGGAVVDMLSTRGPANYIYVQPSAYVTSGTSDFQHQPTAATGSLTDLFGRVAALPDCQTAVPAASVIVSRTGGGVTPSQPLTMFRIVGGGSQAAQQHIMAYRQHVGGHQQPVLLPASAVRPAAALQTSTFNQQVLDHQSFTHYSQYLHTKRQYICTIWS